MFLLIYLICFPVFVPAQFQWLSPTDHNFGTIPKGKPVSERFAFMNISDTPLIIDNVRTDCSCTAGDWDKAATLPHQTGVIIINYDAGKIGYFHKKIAVWLHGQRKPEYISIEGEVQE